MPHLCENIDEQGLGSLDYTEMADLITELKAMGELLA